MLGQKTYPEISQQYLAIQHAWAYAKTQQAWITKYIGNPKYDEVIFIGSGSSYYQSQIMATTYTKWTGKKATAAPSSEIFLFRDNFAAADQQILLVGVSRSGESSEVILALESVAGLSNWDTCGITCYENSRMAQMSDCLVSELGKEESTVMTKSFSSMTFLMQAAIAFAANDNDAVTALGELTELNQAVSTKADEMIKSFIHSHQHHKHIFLGMGSYFGLAQEACLKLKEMSYVWTESFGTLEFRHGPKSIVDSETLVCLLVSEKARSYELKVAEEMKQFGATILLIVSKAGEDTAFADGVFEIGGEAWSDEARCVLYLPALQYYGYYSALKLNVDPDEPRNLTQVVKI